MEVTVNSKEDNSLNFCLNNVQEFGLFPTVYCSSLTQLSPSPEPMKVYFTLFSYPDIFVMTVLSPSPEPKKMLSPSLKPIEVLSPHLRSL